MKHPNKIEICISYTFCYVIYITVCFDTVLESYIHIFQNDGSSMQPRCVFIELWVVYFLHFTVHFTVVTISCDWLHENGIAIFYLTVYMFSIFNTEPCNSIFWVISNSQGIFLSMSRCHKVCLEFDYNQANMSILMW